MSREGSDRIEEQADDGGSYCEEDASSSCSSPPVVEDPDLLLSCGICRVPIPVDRIDPDRWAQELSRVTPLNMTFEGDGEYSFYRNIMDEPDFPFDAVLDDSAVGDAIVRHFGVKNLDDELRLDDAFCVHYNTEQEDTSGAKHLDPSDITVNICLEKSDDVRGSHVMFYGTRNLLNIEHDRIVTEGNGKDAEPSSSDDGRKSHCTPVVTGKSGTSGPAGTTPSDEDQCSGGSSRGRIEKQNFRFCVEQLPGTATIHWGDHPHETMAMEGSGGRRTNVILTYCYTDPTRSDVALRSCYAV